MRRFINILILLIFLSLNSYSQKKNGTIYLEHETIDKIANLWDAFEKGDKESYMAYFADSVKVFTNGKKLTWTKSSLEYNIDWWHKEFENIKFKDAKPAYPDALEYEDGSIWVQDWVKLTARNIKTGINLDLPLHRMYRFNKDGKIILTHWYYDNDIFEAIQNSHLKEENGTVFINHPYIITARKTMNALIDKDFDAWASYYSPKAKFGNFVLKYGEYQSLTEKKEALIKFYSPDKKFHIEQTGYPDCIYYAKNNSYIVYSWWKMTIIKNGEKYTFPYMISQSFDKDGKISFENVYVSSNHLDGW